MKHQKQCKWTVFFLIKSAGSASIREVIRMINEIRCTEMLGRLPVILCMNFFKGDLDAVLEGRESLIAAERSSQKFTTMFFSIVPDNHSQGQFPNKLEIIGEAPNFDITSPRSIEDFFRHEILMQYKAKHYLMISWDHGRLFGIFNEGAEGLVADKKDLAQEIHHEEGVTILTMEELNEAIQLAFGKQKVDVMIMMNCFMQFIDAGYALRRSVKYLVAPETFIYIDGYNYPFLFQLLINKPNITPRKLAKQVVRSFATKVYSTFDDGVAHKKNTAIFATDLRYYRLLGELVDRLVDHFMKNIPQIKLLIDPAREFCTIIQAKKVIDFFGFISFLHKENIFKENPLVASTVLSIRDLIVVESFKGNGFTRQIDDLVNPPSGISIHLPMALPTDEPNPGFDDFFKTEFSRKTKWLEFIKAINEE